MEILYVGDEHEKKIAKHIFPNLFIHGFAVESNSRECFRRQAKKK
jgi:hypothetical protein